MTYIERNIDEAVKWLRKAAELGNQEAMLKLGTLLYNDKRSFSDIIAEYEAQINKVTGLLQQSQEEYETAKNKNREYLRKISEQEYTCGYNDAKAGKRNKYIKEELQKMVNNAVSFGNVRVGSIIKFGNYPQSTKDQKEPIEWRVLVVDNGKALLISKYALDCKKYNEKYESTTWERCTLRNWLNSDFIKNSFTDNEQNSILLSDVKADKSPEYGGTSQGYDIRDKVFLLSAKEAEMYFKSDDDRKCTPTKIAVSNGVATNNGHCWWWLRSLGYFSNYATYVYADGSVNYFGINVLNNGNVVRPALWINLKS